MKKINKTQIFAIKLVKKKCVRVCMCVYMYLRVRVCVTERERDGKTDREGQK